MKILVAVFYYFYKICVYFVVFFGNHFLTINMNSTVRKIREILYQHHRRRVITACSRVDHHPPIIHVNQNLRLTNMKVDGDLFSQRQTYNLERILQPVLTYGTTEGCVHPFLQERIPIYSRLPVMQTEISQNQVKNVELGERILSAKSVVDNKTPREFKRPLLQKKLAPKKAFNLPLKILEKYKGCVNIPRDPKISEQLLRPQVFLDLEIKDVNPLVNLVIQLYTEACPQVVLEFVRACAAGGNRKLVSSNLSKGGSSTVSRGAISTVGKGSGSSRHSSSSSLKGIRFRRCFPSLWLSGDIPLSNGALTKPKIEYDMRALDHGSSLGILSIAKSNLKGFQNGILDFVITFKPMSLLNGHRVAFGRVLQGKNHLMSLPQYGTKSGTIKRPILLARSGMVNNN